MKRSKEERNRFTEENLGLFYFFLNQIKRKYPYTDEVDLEELVNEAFVRAMNIMEMEDCPDVTFGTILKWQLRGMISHYFTNRRRRSRIDCEVIHYQGAKEPYREYISNETDDDFLNKLASHLMENNTIKTDEKEWVEWALDFCTPCQKKLVRECIIDNRDCADVARELGVSRQSVHETMKRGLERIKKGVANERAHCGI